MGRQNFLHQLAGAIALEGELQLAEQQGRFPVLRGLLQVVVQAFQQLADVSRRQLNLDGLGFMLYAHARHPRPGGRAKRRLPKFRPAATSSCETACRAGLREGTRPAPSLLQLKWYDEPGAK